MAHAHRTAPAFALALAAMLVGSWSGRAAVTDANGTIGVHIYHPPAGTPGENTAQEPSIGHDHATDTTMYQSGLHTFAVKFDDTVQPAADTWTDVSSPLTSQTSLDPILFTDADKGRTWVSQLVGPSSFSAFTDDDGAHYTPSNGGSILSGVDHQSIGSGPYNPNGIPPQSTVFGHAVFYCSQGVAAAFCGRSDNGGITYGAGIPVYSVDQCGGLHGHIRVAPNGLDMLPNQNCDKQVDAGAGAQQAANGTTFPYQGLITSNDNGNTWLVQTIPGSHATLRSDPSVAADNANTVYYGYEDPVKATANAGTQTGGKAMIATATIGTGGTLTWSTPVDVGAAVGVQNVQFPEVIAGDAGRAAYAFLGSTTAGNPEDAAFTGHWDLYLAITLDGGASWRVTNTTPTDPVERGCTYLAGNGTCPNTSGSSKRNLLDFMDITVDEDGHTIVGYADGCINACATGSPCTSNVPGSPQVCNTGPAASTARYASIARVQCGPSLYKEYDNKYACAPAQIAEAPLVAGLILAAAATVAVPAIIRRRRHHGHVLA